MGTFQVYFSGFISDFLSLSFVSKRHWFKASTPLSLQDMVVERGSWTPERVNNHHDLYAPRYCYAWAKKAGEQALK